LTLLSVTDLAIKGVQSFMKDNSLASADEIAEVVVNQQMASALKSTNKVHIFLRAVITPDYFKNKEIQANSETIKKITQTNPIMERHLIGAVEEICADSIVEPKHFPVLLKLLFDEEALAEDVILEWAACDDRSEYTTDAVDEDMRAGLRKRAEPFVAWLEESDSDSDGSDSDSD